MGHNPGWRHHAFRAAAWVLLAALLTSAPALAQDPRPVYRCPGPPVLYTDALSADEARSRNCRTIDGASVTVVQAPRRPAQAPASAAAPGAAPGAAPAARPPGDTRIDPAAQRARDADARRILQF
ncbi:MAG: hypothetical protein ACK5IH_08715, partial [Betaproteobacteria bacterium]